MASTAVRTSLTAVTMITAMRSSRARICGRNVGPGGPGMRTSRSTTSTRRARRTSSPLAPSSASRTSNSFSKMTRNDSRTPCSSSMTSATGLGRDTSTSTLMASGLIRDLEDDVFAAGAASLDLHGDALTRLERGHRLLELVETADAAAVDFEEDVALLDARSLRRAARLDLRDHDARAPAQPVRARHLLAERLDGQPQPFTLRTRRQHSLLTRLLADLDRELRRLAIAQHGERGRAARYDGGHALLKLRHFLYRSAAQLDDDVARFHAGGFGGTILEHVGHEDPALRGHPEPRRQLVGQVLDGDAEPPAHDTPLGDQLGHDFTGHVDGNREADALPGRDDRGIDADDTPVEIEQRPARVARIDGRVGLDKGLVGRHADSRAPRRRDDADGDGPIEAERIADGDGPLADAKLVGVPEHGRRQRARARVDLDDREIRLRIAAHEGCGEFAVVGQPHLDVDRAFHDVGVGQDIAAGIHDDARAGRARLLPRRPALEEALVELGAEELAEALLALGRHAALDGRRSLGLDADVDHRGRHPVRD